MYVVVDVGLLIFGIKRIKEYWRDIKLEGEVWLGVSIIPFIYWFQYHDVVPLRTTYFFLQTQKWLPMDLKLYYARLSLVRHTQRLSLPLYSSLSLLFLFFLFITLHHCFPFLFNIPYKCDWFFFFSLSLCPSVFCIYTLSWTYAFGVWDLVATVI